MEKTRAQGAARRAKRANGEGAVHARKDGRIEVKFTLPNGKRASVYGRNRGEALARKDEALKKARRGIDLKAERQPLAVYLETWYREVASPKLRPKTLVSYRSNLDCHILPGLGDTTLSELAPGGVQRFLNAKRAAGLSPRSVNYLRAILRTALAEAQKRGYIERNVAALTTPQREVKTPVKPLTAAQAKALIAFAKEDPLGPLIAAALATGMRLSELLGLRWQDIERDVIHVRHAIQKVKGADGVSEWQFVEPKSERSRRPVPLAPQARDAITEQKRRLPLARELAGPRWQEWELVFPSSVGTPQDGPNVTKRLQRLLAAAELPRQRFHDLRHGAASFLLAQGVPLKVVQEILGHSQISLTADTYSHVAPALLQDAAAAMGRALGVPQRVPLSSKLSSKAANPRTVRPRIRKTRAVMREIG